MSAAKQEMYVQYICTTKPYCKCSSIPNEWDECCCLRDGKSGVCKHCLASMILIDFDTGEPPVS